MGHERKKFRTMPLAVLTRCQRVLFQLGLEIHSCPRDWCQVGKAVNTMSF